MARLNRGITDINVLFLEAVNTELEHLLFIGHPQELASMNILKRIGWDSKPPTRKNFKDVQDKFPFLSIEQTLLTMLISQEVKHLSRVLGNTQAALLQLVERVKRQDQDLDVSELKLAWDNLLKHVNMDKKKHEKSSKLKRKSSEVQNHIQGRAKNGLELNREIEGMICLSKPLKRKLKKESGSSSIAKKSKKM